MKIFDLHQDLMSHIRFRDKLKQSHQTDFDSLEDSNVDLVIATAFPLPQDDDQTNPVVHDLISEEINLYISELENRNDWRLVLSADDLKSEYKKLLLHIEGLNIFKGTSADWQQLEVWLQNGVRSIGTHWNISNALGGGTLQPEQPLTSLGEEVIHYLETQSVLFDMAHMGRRTFFDVVKIIKRPVYVSHGNADRICPHVRNYTDEQLECIAKTDGVLGLFFPNTFVKGVDTQGVIDDVVAHFVYVKKCIGTRHIAIGSDFGGIVSGCVTDLEHVSEITTLLHHLAIAGFTENEIEEIAYKNAARIIESHTV